MKRPLSPGSMLRLAGLTLLAAFILSSCAGLPPATTGSTAPSGPASTAATTETHIVIFHSNDVHGRIDAFAKVKVILDAEKKTGADVFYVSAGDNFTGDPVIDRFDPPGEPMLDLLGRMGLAVVCPGNHEFDYGLATVRKFASRFPMVSANIEAPVGVFPELRPWTVLKTRNGTGLVVFGLIQIEPGNGLPSTHPDRVKGLRFREPLAKALEMKSLRAKGQVLIALTHIGHDQDLLLARQMPELDLIIGGHSHTRVDPAVTVNGVLIAQAGSGNLFLGRIDLWLRDGRVVEKQGRLIDLGQVKDEDASIKALVTEYRRNPAMARVLAEAPFEISGMNALGSLMTDAIRRTHGLDIAFQNNGGIRVGRLPKVITLRDAYTLDPFGNQVVEIAMTPAEIRSLIKAAFEKRGDIDLQVSGITYVVRTDATPRVREILLRLPDGTPLPEDRTYKVGLSSYIASSTSFTHQDPGRSLQTTTVDDLISFLEKGADLGLYRDIIRAIWEKAPAPSGN
ncbi:MAG: 5'-nucleotidase C-terminal domain-containing protein [Candidatus Aminicenantes bacterium]|nr:5'-nucleotidase C-terminal domain-containing protein [Candidatus Aminicenantes bacterium]